MNPAIARAAWSKDSDGAMSASRLPSSTPVRSPRTTPDSIKARESNPTSSKVVVGASCRPGTRTTHAEPKEDLRVELLGRPLRPSGCLHGPNEPEGRRLPLCMPPARRSSPADSLGLLDLRRRGAGWIPGPGMNANLVWLWRRLPAAASGPGLTEACVPRQPCGSCGCLPLRGRWGSVVCWLASRTGLQPGFRTGCSSGAVDARPSLLLRRRAPHVQEKFLVFTVDAIQVTARVRFCVRTGDPRCGSARAPVSLDHPVNTRHRDSRERVHIATRSAPTLGNEAPPPAGPRRTSPPGPHLSSETPRGASPARQDKRLFSPHGAALEPGLRSAVPMPTLRKTESDDQ